MRDAPKRVEREEIAPTRFGGADTHVNPFLRLGSVCYVRSGMPRNPWTQIRSRIAYRNAWMQVREDDVVRPDGRPGIYGVVEIRPSVGVLALNDHGEAALVGQWRYPTG